MCRPRCQKALRCVCDLKWMHLNGCGTNARYCRQQERLCIVERAQWYVSIHPGIRTKAHCLWTYDTINKCYFRVIIALLREISGGIFNADVFMWKLKIILQSKMLQFILQSDLLVQLKSNRKQNTNYKCNTPECSSPKLVNIFFNLIFI